VLGLDGTRTFVTFVYGDCEPSGGDEPSCVPPLQIQVSPLCGHLEAVTASRRKIRGAVVGFNRDGAPVLLTARAQVKVYTGEGANAHAALEALERLRSANRVPPVVRASDRLPAAVPASWAD